jgi:Ca2+-binding RTX toxin-like protein
MAEQDGSAVVERRAPSAGKVAAGAGIALGVTLVTGGTAHATDFTVTNLDAAGPGSLRDAIDQANLNAGPDRVLFQSGLTGTIHLNDPTDTYGLKVTEALDIVGPGADQITISGDARSRIFNIQPNTPGDDVSISGLKMIQGEIVEFTYSSGPTPPFGGDIYSNGADLTVANSVVRTGTAFAGGGISEKYGTLALRDSTVTGNSASLVGGGIYIGRNPSQYESPPATSGQTDQQTLQPSVITGSTISNNTAGAKYGFDQAGAQAPSGTDATDPSDRNVGAGGVAVESALNVENSTLNHNNAVGGIGGGIGFTTREGQYGSDLQTPGANQLRVESTTISGNSAGTGGGIYWYAYTPASSTQPATPNPVIENSIVADNDADSQSHGNDLGGARATEVVPPPPSGADDVNRADATFDTAFSLIKDPSTVTLNETVPGSNITGQDPQLGALNDNGGATQTMALQPGSPAIDHGRTPAGETTDQRGQTRPFDLPQIGNSAAPGADGADMGAFEVQGIVPTGTCQGKPATISGTENRDVILGTPGPDVIVGFGGNDQIKALQGDDLVCAGDGIDSVTGGLGDDRLLGEGGNDRIYGQSGNDTLIDNQGDDLESGGVGNDTEKGGPGEDRVFGANGNDRLFGQAADDVILGAKGNDFLRGGPGNDRLSGGVGVNNVQQ